VIFQLIYPHVATPYTFAGLQVILQVAQQPSLGKGDTAQLAERFAVAIGELKWDK
jgi:hypothetical protein